MRSLGNAMQRGQRDELQDRVDELERDLAKVSVTNGDYESAIADLEQKPRNDLAELTRLRTEVAAASKRANSDLEDSNREQWEHVAGGLRVRRSGDRRRQRARNVERDALVMDDYAQVGLARRRSAAGEQLDQAFLDIDDAETAYTGASARCTSALEGPPNCDGERATMEVAVEAFTANNDRGPESEDELVSDGFIRQPSDEFDLTNGEVTPPRAPCARRRPDSDPVRSTSSLDRASPGEARRNRGPHQAVTEPPVGQSATGRLPEVVVGRRGSRRRCRRPLSRTSLVQVPGQLWCWCWMNVVSASTLPSVPGVGVALSSNHGSRCRIDRDPSTRVAVTVLRHGPPRSDLRSGWRSACRCRRRGRRGSDEPLAA